MKKWIKLLLFLVLPLISQAQTSQSFRRVSVDTIKGLSGSDVYFKSNIVGWDNSTYNLGSASRYFKNIYIDTITTRLPDSSVLFVGSNGRLTTDSASFVWDNVNKRLAIGNSKPLHTLDLYTNSFTRVWAEGNAASIGFFGVRNYGTRTAPLPPPSLGTSVEFMLGGWNGTSFTTQRRAGIRLVNTSDWTSTDNGAEVWFHVTANGVLTNLIPVAIKQNGSLVVSNLASTVTPLARFQVNGSGSTSATFNSYFQNSSSGIIMTLRDDQRVGIKTATPSFDLDVDGTERIATTPVGTSTDSILVKDASTGQVKAIAQSTLRSFNDTTFGTNKVVLSNNQGFLTTNVIDTAVLQTNNNLDINSNFITINATNNVDILADQDFAVTALGATSSITSSGTFQIATLDQNSDITLNTSGSDAAINITASDELRLTADSTISLLHTGADGGINIRSQNSEIAIASPTFVTLGNEVRIATPTGSQNDSVLTKNPTTGAIQVRSPANIVSEVTGWAAYQDNQFTVGSPFTISPASQDTMPNNALGAGTITSQLPIDASSGFYTASQLK